MPDLGAAVATIIVGFFEATYYLLAAFNLHCAAGMPKGVIVLGRLARNIIVSF